MAEATGEAALAKTLASIKKNYDLSIGSLSAMIEPVVSISTGNLAIDHITGVGGFPLGRSAELFGLPGSGKTTSALLAAAHLQAIIRAGGNEAMGIGPDDRILYLDYEHALDLVYAAKLGLDVEHPSFLFAQPDSLESGANAARQLIDTGLIRMAVWDSVASMASERALANETGHAALAMHQAALIADLLKTLNPALHRHRCAAIFLNHLSEKIAMGGGRPGMPPATTTPGGRSLKFYASMRLEYTPIKNLKSDVRDLITQESESQVTGSTVRVRVVKNKVAPPFRQAVVRVRFGMGFDNFWTALQILIAHKRVVYGSGYFYFEKLADLLPSGLPDDMPRQTTGTHRPHVRGEQALFDFADAHPAWRAEVIAAAGQVLSADVSVLDAVTPAFTPDDDSDAEESE